MPKVVLLNTIVRGAPGSTVRAFGHDFVIQPDGRAIADIHKDFLAAELAAGRYELVEVEEQRQAKLAEMMDAETKTDRAFKSAEKDEESAWTTEKPAIEPGKEQTFKKQGEDVLSDFGMKAINYFGAENEETMMKKLNPLVKLNLQKFATTRLGITMPSSMSKTAMLKEILETTRMRANKAKEIAGVKE